MPIEGNLQDMYLTDIIQLNCRNAEEARVSLSNGERSGAIYFSDGDVIHAIHEDQTGEEAVYQLLSWQEGHFIIEKDIASPARTIQIPWGALLLQGMKYVDESRTGSEAEEKEVTEETTILHELADSLNGFVAGQIVDFEGQVIADLTLDEAFDERKATASLAKLAEQANEALLAMEAGQFQETIILTEKYHFITRPIGSSRHYIWIVLNAEGSIGAARLYMTDKEADLLDILSALKRAGGRGG